MATTKEQLDKYIKADYDGHPLIPDEEYDMFIRFYDSILSNINYPNYNKKIAEEIAYDRTYNNTKYTYFYYLFIPHFSPLF